MPNPSDLISTTQVAELFKVTKATVGNWRLREQFIEPALQAGGTNLYLLADVEAWGRRTGRLPYVEGRLYDSFGVDVTDSYAQKKGTA